MWYIIFFILQLAAATSNVYFFFHMHDFIWLKVSLVSFLPSLPVLAFAIYKRSGGGQYNCISILFMLLNITAFFFFSFLYIASRYMIGT